MNKQKFGVRLWLWIALGAAVVIAIGFLVVWKLSGNNTSTSTKTSPIPTKSAVTSASPGKTSTPSSNQTATSTATPMPTPPEGWKIEKYTLNRGQNVDANATYQLFLKNNWQSTPAGGQLWQESVMVYSDNTSCVPTSYGIDNAVYNNYCLFRVSISREPALPQNIENIFYYEGKNNSSVYSGVPVVTLSFTKNISPEDKQIVVNSFNML